MFGIGVGKCLSRGRRRALGDRPMALGVAMAPQLPPLYAMLFRWLAVFRCLAEMRWLAPMARRVPLARRHAMARPDGSPTCDGSPEGSDPPPRLVFPHHSILRIG